MTDNEIIKALECCSEAQNCTPCKYEPTEYPKSTVGCCNELMKNAVDLINRQKAEIERNRRIIKIHEAVIEILEKDYIPAADVEPVKHGEWNDLYGDYKIAKCSKCGEEYEVSDTGTALLMLFKAFKDYYKFCPRCGARMDGEAEDG